MATFSIKITLVLSLLVLILSLTAAGAKEPPTVEFSIWGTVTILAGNSGKYEM